MAIILFIALPRNGSMTRQALVQGICLAFECHGCDYFAGLESKTSFDAIAAMPGTGKPMFVKALENVDGFTREMNDRLQHLSTLLDCWLFLIGECGKAGALLDGVVYRRYNLDAMSLATFGMLLEGELPELRKSKKLLCEIDGKKLAGARTSSNLSRADVSRATGISEEMLYRYEHGICKPEKKTLDSMERLLGTKLSAPVPLERSAAVGLPRESFLGFPSAYVRSPITLFMSCNTKKFGSPHQPAATQAVVAVHVTDDPRTLAKKAGILKNVSNILKSKSCIISNLKSRGGCGIPVMSIPEIHSLGKREFLRFLGEKNIL